MWFGWVFACVHAIPPLGSATHVMADIWFLFFGSGQMVALAPNPCSHASVTPDRSRWEKVVRQQVDGSRRGAPQGGELHHMVPRPLTGQPPLFWKQKLCYFNQLLGSALLTLQPRGLCTCTGGREGSLQPQPCSSAVPQRQEVCGLLGPRCSGPPVPSWPALEGSGQRWGYSTAGPGTRGRRAPSGRRQNLAA